MVISPTIRNYWRARKSCDLVISSAGEGGPVEIPTAKKINYAGGLEILPHTVAMYLGPVTGLY